jgi:DNA polymerase III delta subunit
MVYYSPEKYPKKAKRKDMQKAEARFAFPVGFSNQQIKNEIALEEQTTQALETQGLSIPPEVMQFLMEEIQAHLLEGDWWRCN